MRFGLLSQQGIEYGLLQASVMYFGALYELTGPDGAGIPAAKGFARKADDQKSSV